MRRLRIANLRFLTIGAMLILLAACGQETLPPPAPPEVEAITVRVQPIPNIVELPGRVQAIRTAEVRARVDGIVQRRLFQEGTDVSAGQALFAIDPRDLRAHYNAARASLARAQATAANARQDVNRYRGLLPEQAISRQEYDAAVARLRTAQADVAQARAQAERARLTLAYTTVTAPIAGRAGRAEVTEGALVSAASGTLLTTIEQFNPVHVNFGQSSSDLLAIRRAIAAGQIEVGPVNTVEVRLVLEDGSTYGITGRMDFLGLAIDPATGTAAARAEFPNPGRMLVPGQFVRAQIRAGTRPGGILIPQRAVRVTPQGSSVMVVGRNNVAEARPVRLGQLDGANWIVLGGLRGGERVIVNGLQKVQPGQPVRIIQARRSPPRPPGR